MINNFRCVTFKKPKQETQCLYCGNVTEIIWVHGHGECAYCRTNIDECCRGEVNDKNNEDVLKEINKNVKTGSI